MGIASSCTARASPEARQSPKDHRTHEEASDEAQAEHMISTVNTRAIDNTLAITPAAINLVMQMTTLISYPL